MMQVVQYIMQMSLEVFCGGGLVTKSSLTLTTPWTVAASVSRASVLEILQARILLFPSPP